MDGKEAIRRLEELLDEESTGTWLEDRTTYDYLYEAAKEFVSRTAWLTDTYRFLTDTDIADYDLPVDFMGMYLRDRSNRFFVKYRTDGANYTLPHRDYEDIKYNEPYSTYAIQLGNMSYGTNKFIDDDQDFSAFDVGSSGSSSDTAYKITVYQNDGTERWAYIGDAASSTDRVNVYKDKKWVTAGWNGDSAGTPSYYKVENISTGTPTYFSIKARDELHSQITGTCTSARDKSADGLSVLRDSSGVFLTTDYVSPGDVIHNVTDGSTGVVVTVTNATTCTVALFGGTDNEWDVSDAYVIQPQGRSQIVLDTPPSVENQIVEVDYIKSPNPVYSSYATYNIPDRAMEAIIKYAAWMYKYRDGEPQFGDALYVMWDKGVREFDRRFNPDKKKRGFTVNYKKRM